MRWTAGWIRSDGRSTTAGCEASGRDGIVVDLVNARREFGQLRRFAALDCVPGPLRDAMNDLIGHHLESRQRALEKSAAEDKTGRLSYLVGRNRLDAPAPPPPAPVQSDEPSTQAGAFAPRRILLSRGPP